MNRLLSFNPEPFESESAFVGAMQMPSFAGNRARRACGCQHGSQLEAELETLVRPRRRALSRPSILARAPAPPSAFDSQAFRRKIVGLANQELARWGNGAIKETDPRTRRVLQDYWKTGAGVSYGADQLGDPSFQNAHPWSAAFISWVMKTAGAGDAFKYSASHSVYTRAAKDNRIANSANPFKAYRVAELAPQAGDLICKSRAGSGSTYDNIRPGMTTHCDIVTEVRPRSLLVVGGNVNNSVAQKTVRTDPGGRITEPNYFAVIRIDGQQPSTPVVPSPTPPRPAAGSPPRLLKQESTPPGTTLYVGIDLKIVDKAGITAPPLTGIFVPNSYLPGAAVDLVLYLHGFKADAIKREAIDQYWNSQRFPYGALREGVTASGRNVALVAPTLGTRSEAGTLVKSGGLDAYLDQVLAALSAYGPQSGAGAPLTLGNLIFACHSGGGWPMRQLAGGQDRALGQLRECWGFDCTYNRGDDAFWADWARARPNARIYIYYISGSKTAPLAESLRNMRVPNAIVQASRDKRHNYVPITHWQERLQGASFLGARPGGPTQPVPPSPSKAPTVPPPGVNYPPPPGYRAFRGRAPREVVAKAQEILHRPDPIGTQIPVSIGGKDYLFAVEWHKHAPTDPVPAALKRWHRGVTVYERGNGSLPRPSGPSAPSGYVPSLTRRRFEEAAARNDWREAFLNLNGLNMYEMLRVLDELAPDRRSALKSQREAFRGTVNMPRIEYAIAVIETRQLPSEAPGDLAATGQVQTAAEFLRERQSPQPNVNRMTKKEFIEFVGKHAQRAMAATGVPASVTVAQAILETGWGKHTIGEAKNLFGIKGRGPAGSVRAPTRERIGGKWITIDADFAKYDSFEQSITEHARFFLRNRRYARAMQFKNDPDAFAREIHKAGYATGPQYADILIKFMRDYNLYRFDQPLQHELAA
jgi:flagellum-specific peptidoglycan hydrolase FlgJ